MAQPIAGQKCRRSVTATFWDLFLMDTGDASVCVIYPLLGQALPSQVATPNLTAITATELGFAPQQGSLSFNQPEGLPSSLSPGAPLNAPIFRDVLRVGVIADTPGGFSYHQINMNGVSYAFPTELWTFVPATFP